MASEAAAEAMPQPARQQLELNVSVLFPVVLGVVRPPPLPEGMAGPVEPDRIVLLNPLTQGMLVLRTEGNTDEVFSNLMRDMAVMASMGDGAQGPPPASKVSIEALKDVGEVTEEEECPVCLEELLQQQQQEEEEEGEKLAVKEMPCGHRFHAGCVEKWLGMHGSCPVCRYLMPAEEEGSGKKGGGGEEQRRAGELWVPFGFDWSNNRTSEESGEGREFTTEQTQQPEDRSSTAE